MIVFRLKSKTAGTLAPPENKGQEIRGQARSQGRQAKGETQDCRALHFYHGIDPCKGLASLPFAAKIRCGGEIRRYIAL
jgi:hypothetical protein